MLGRRIDEYSFVLKHKFGVEDKVADAHSHIGCRVEVIGFDRVKDAYSSHPGFGLVFSRLLSSNDRSYVDFVLHDPISRFLIMHR